jgi:hypothetical protein
VVRVRIRWRDAPEKHDWRSARDYLTLLMVSSDAMELAQLLRDESASARFKAKDIIRASGLEVLPLSNRHVCHNLRRIREGGRLSPILLVRPLSLGSPLVIADGYHRACAVYHVGEDIPIPCRIVGAPGIWRPGG